MTNRPAANETPTTTKQPQKYLLASSTNRVLIHGIDDSIPVAAVSDPHAGYQVSALTWSHNNTVIASCGVNSNQVTMARASDGTVLQVMELCPRGISVTDLCFSSKSSHIAFGCDDSSVGILNVKAKRVETAIRDHDSAYTIRSVSFNVYDSLLATASSDGELVVNQINLSESNQATENSRVFRDRSMRSSLIMARFSSTKRHVLASAYENGTICVWDLQTIMQQRKESQP